MKQKTPLFLFSLLIFPLFSAQNGKTNPLQACWEKQVKLQEGNYFVFSYQEKLNELYHSQEPWQQLNYAGKGTIWYNQDNFLKQDTLVSGRRTLYSKIHFTKTELLFQDHGDKNLSAITKSMFLDQTFETARYTPATLINYFFVQKIPEDKTSNKEFSLYKTRINKTIVTLFIRNSDKLLEKITTLQHDDLHGDLLNTFTYSDYSTRGSLAYPKTIRIEKVNGKIHDEVSILTTDLVGALPSLLEKPADYTIGEDIVEKPETKTEKYSEAIHFIDMPHTGSKVTVVEFSDFLLVAEAPLNSQNGELIISEAKKIAPGKPIKYFTFGHHHPHYLGGMRAFIHKEVTILSVREDLPYLGYLANAPHTIEPDSLQLQPKPYKIEEIKDSMTISDGNFEMKIYFIGKKSGHTSDYLLYYFPAEKLLLEGDLIWIEKEGEIKKAGKNQAGVYYAIKDLGIEVETIVQTWGIEFGAYKSVIPFEDLERSVNVK